MLTKLLTNHMDAWGLTLTISSFVLVIHEAYSPSAIMLTIILTICYWLGFAINDYFDAPFDAQDAQKAARNFFTQQTVSNNRLLLAFCLISVVMLLGLASFGWRGILTFVVGYLAMWSYSAPPLRLKNRPGLDVLLHTLFVQTFPYYATLYVLAIPWLPVDFVLLTTFALASLSAQLEQQVRDFELDRLTSATFAIRAGLPITTFLLRLVTLLLMTNFLVNVILGHVPGYLVPFAFIAIPILIHRFIRDYRQPRSEMLVRLALLVTLLYATFIWAYLMIV